MKVGVLASGGGSNLQALIDADGRGDLGPARLAVVGVNVAGCGALTRARLAGLATFVVEHGSHPSRDAFDQALLAALGGYGVPSRDAFDQALLAALGGYGVDLVVLAGFMRILTPAFPAAFPGRVINIHPSLLPSFPGVNAQAQAFRAGVKVSGCTVHFVEAGVDSGPIIAQSTVPVRDDDDEEDLRLRILAEEHKLLPSVVRAMAEGRVEVAGRRVRVHAAPA